MREEVGRQSRAHSFDVEMWREVAGRGGQSRSFVSLLRLREPLVLALGLALAAAALAALEAPEAARRCGTVGMTRRRNWRRIKRVIINDKLSVWFSGCELLVGLCKVFC